MGYSPFLVSVMVCLMVAFGDCMKCHVFREDNDNYPSNAAMTGYVNQCPSAVNHPHDEYCCYDLQFRARCCGLNDFLVNMSVLVVVVLILLMLLATVVSCVCCICCPCCFLYKRRHASGRVYRSEPVPKVTPAEQNTEYTPIHRAHLPPGAYPVLPPTAEIRNLKSHQ